MFIRFMFCLLVVGSVSQIFFIDLEEVFFINEIYCLAGFYILLKRLPGYLTRRQNMVMYMILFLLSYGFVYAVYSYFYLRQGTNYEFLRTLPLWYSIVAFFLGVELIRQGSWWLDLLSRLSRKFGLWFAAIFVSFGGGGVATYSPAAVFFLLGRARMLLLLILMYGAWEWLAMNGSETQVMIFLSYLVFMVALYCRTIQKYVVFNVWLHAIFFALAILVLAWLHQRLALYYTIGVGTAGVDSNSLWRLMFWAYGVVHNFLPHPLFGIGFGTPIYDASDPATAFIRNGNFSDPHFLYTLGMHNSYITVLSRLGLAGFIPLMVINYYLFKPILKFRLLRDPVIFALFFAYSCMAIIALFHVVLESPRHSGIYWIFCGMLFAAINRYKAHILTVSDSELQGDIPSNAALLQENLQRKHVRLEP